MYFKFKKLDIVKLLLVRRSIFFYILTIALSIVLYSTLRSKILINDLNFSIYNSLIKLYSYQLLAGAKLLLNIAGKHPIVNYGKSALVVMSNTTFYVGYFYFSLKHLAIVTIIGLITPVGIKRQCYFILMAVATIFLFNILRIAFLSVCIQNIHFKVYFQLSMMLRNVLVLFMIYFFWQRLPVIKNKICLFFNFSETQYNSTFFKLIVIIVIVFIVETLIFSSLFSGTCLLLTQTVLHIAQGIVHSFGYGSKIVGCTICGYGTWVYLADSCLGIDLMLLFGSFVYLIPSKLIHKVWFIPMGILTIYFVNTIRVAFVYIHLVNHGGHYQLPIEVHNLFTYPVYLITLGLWVIWINKFMIKTTSDNNN